jgi:uncharacterized protein
MALFVLVNNDKANALALRMATREAHLAYVGKFRDRVKLGGPVLDDNGDMAGSIIMFEAETIEEARTFGANDPYALAGLFAQTQVLAFRMTLQNLV